MGVHSFRPVNALYLRGVRHPSRLTGACAIRTAMHCKICKESAPRPVGRFVVDPDDPHFAAVDPLDRPTSRASVAPAHFKSSARLVESSRAKEQEGTLRMRKIIKSVHNFVHQQR